MVQKLRYQKEIALVQTMQDLDNIRIPPIPDRLAMPETRSTCASPNQVTAITGVNEPWGEEHLQAFSEWFRPIYSSSPNSEQSPSQLSLLEFYWGWGAAISFEGIGIKMARN